MKWLLLVFFPFLLFAVEPKDRVAVIVNPISGGKEKSQLVAQIVQDLNNQFDVEVLYTKAPGHATQLAREAVAGHAKIVVAVGGDGSVHEICQALIGSDTALAILPTGSGNGLARHLGIPLNPIKGIELIRSGRTIPIDTVRANEGYFVCVAGIGFDADIGWAFAEYGKRGFFSYLTLSLQQYWKHRPQIYELTIDGETIVREAFLISFANGSEFGNGAKIAPQARIDDGWFDVVILHPFPFLKSPRVAYRLFNGTLDRSGYLEHFRCKEVTLKQPQLKAHIDGEPVLFEEGLHLQIVPQSLNVLVP